MSVALPLLGLGCAPLGGLFSSVSDEDAQATVDAAWEAGIRLYDVAPLYGVGRAEERLGAALQGRDGYVLSTKVGRLIVEPGTGGGEDTSEFFDAPAGEVRFDFSRDGIRRSLEDSLQRLGLERVDVVHVHDPDDHLDQAIAEAVPALCELRDEGVIGAVGAGMNVAASCCGSSSRPTSTASCWPAATRCSTTRARGRCSTRARSATSR